MKSIIAVLVLFIPFALMAQTTISWKGGTPGKESAWNEARNWDAHRLPNENDRVIIKAANNGHFAQPVITAEVQVAWVEIHSGASLHISDNSRLILDGETTYSEGITIYGGELLAKGEIIFKDIDPEFIARLAPVCLDSVMSYYSELHGYVFSVRNSY